MAYDTQEERLKVQGSEQITRDLKVNRDAYINGSLNASGDIDIQGQVIARDDVSISGDLYVNGTEHINDSETSQTSDNYLVLRHNKTTALGNNEHAGIAVHNYSPNKTATCTVDNQGTWRVADNTETSTVYTNVSYFNGVYYEGLTTTTTTVANGIKTTWDEDELDECVYYSTSYYHFDGANWFAVGLSNNILTIGAQITDATTITALEALTRNDLVYFRSLTVTAINEIENEPLLTRDESTNLQNKDLLTWDSTAQKAVAASRATADDQALVWKSGNYEWKGITDTVASGNSDLVTSNGVATTIGTLDVASVGGSGKYISEISESDGKISATEGNIDTSITQDSPNPVTSGAVWTALQSITPPSVVDAVTAGDMRPVTSNAVAGALTSLLSKLATQFSTSENYEVDTYVSYNGNIYRCVNTHPAGAWVASDFIEVNLANDLMQIIKAMNGGIDMNEIAELFNINKNVSNINMYEFQGAYAKTGLGTISSSFYKSIRSDDLVVFSNDKDNIDLIVDLKDCVVYHTYNNSYVVAGSRFVFETNNTSYVPIYGVTYNADNISLGNPYMFELRSKKYIGTDGIQKVYFISNNYVYYFNVNVNYSSPTQKMSGNGIAKGKGILLVTSANGVYTLDTLLNNTPVRVFTSASSYPCFGKNKFAVLVGSTVYYSEDTINWNATSMTGVSELYFSCGKFVARKSSGDIYYSDDLSEWKLFAITTTTGIFTDTVFVWGNYYTRDFEVVDSLTASNNPDKGVRTIGSYTYKLESNYLYRKNKYTADTEYKQIESSVYGNQLVIGDKFMLNTHTGALVSPLYECGGDWCRMSLN